MSWVAWIGWGGALGLGVAAPDMMRLAGVLGSIFKVFLIKGVGLVWRLLRMRISTLAAVWDRFRNTHNYSQHLVASTPAVLIGGNCRSPWHLHGDSDVNRLEYSQIQFQKLSSFEEAKCLAGRGEFLCL